MSPTREIRLEDLSDDLISEETNGAEWTDLLNLWVENSLAKGENNLLEKTLPDFEKTMIKATLRKTKGKKKEAANILGWGRNTLTRKIKELGLDR